MIEPSKVNAVASKKEDENLEFRAFLKNCADYDELDKQFARLHNELFAGYDCCKCNNCCRVYSVTVQKDEIGTIAAFLGLTEQAFTEAHLTQSGEDYAIKVPCCFLDENGECAIQTCKPVECREFPYTNKPDRAQSLLGVISFAEVCPVVFEILERLKAIYNFKA